MRKSERIPRKDHEVYFIDISGYPVKWGNKLRSGIASSLLTLHPGFSQNTVIDIKTKKIGDKEWAMVTVMNQELLQEYRLLYPGKTFYTATSCLLYSDEFEKNGLRTYAGETIGYSAETGLPVSLPSSVDAQDSSIFPNPDRRALLFRPQKRTQLSFLVIFVLLAVLISGLVLKNINADHASKSVDSSDAESVPALVLIPPCLNVLEDIVNAVKSTEGFLSRFSYTETASPELILVVRKTGPQELAEAVQGYQYLSGPSVSEIAYSEGVSEYKADLKLDTRLLRYPVYRGLTGSAEGFAVVEQVSSLTVAAGAKIIRQRMAKTAIGDSAIEMELLIPGYSIEDTLLLFDEYFRTADLRIVAMDLSLDKATALFSLRFSVLKILPESLNSENRSVTLSGIARIFGYVQNARQPGSATPTAAQIQSQGYFKVGSIRGDGNSTIVYYKNSEGKIFTIEEKK